VAHGQRLEWCHAAVPAHEFRARGVDDVEGRYLKRRYGAVLLFDDEMLEVLVASEDDSD